MHFLQSNLFQREGNTKKEARHNASEALLAYFDITDDEIREKALDIFELATKKNSKLNWDYIIDEFDDAGQPRCKYKEMFDTKFSNTFCILRGLHDAFIDVGDEMCQRQL